MEATVLEIPFDIKRENRPKNKLSRGIGLRAVLPQKSSKRSIKREKRTPQAVEKTEAIKKATAYFSGDTLAAQVWVDKYALKDSKGTIYEASPTDMHLRLSHEIARIESQYPNPLSQQKIFELIDRFKYIVPQGGPMTGIGNPFQVASLSNCFVIGHQGNADSYGAVMQTDEEQVQLMKRRGGVGHDLSNIRPTGSYVKNSALTATGVVPFMQRYSNSTREVAQGGRRGALMLSLHIKHPDIERFIDAKQDTTKITGANVSVKIDNAFMNAVKQGDDHQLQYPIDDPWPQIKTKVQASQLWDKIIHNAWASAEPGLLFWDTILSESVPDCYSNEGFTTVSTNPCGEIPLCPYDSCRLLAINLYSYVEKPFTENAFFNFDTFKEHARYAQRIMDDIIDLEMEKIDQILAKIKLDPEPEELKRTELHLWQKIRKKCMQGRRQGIGITAEGDMLAALGLRYGSEQAIYHATEVHKVLAMEVYRGSVELAKDRGAFPIYDWQKEQKSAFIQRIAKEDPELFENMKKYGRRNIAMLTIAPTGTTSLMTQTTSGIEPVFRVSYKRRVKANAKETSKSLFTDKIGDTWYEHHVFHHHFETWLKTYGYNVEEVRSLSDNELEAIIALSPYAKSTANDVDWVSKVAMQGTIQKWVDHSISVTVNLPNTVSKRLVGDIYFKAWESGCKGITVYRDGSRDGILVTEQPENADRAEWELKRPKELEADIMRFNNNDEKWIAVVGKMNDLPFEVFTGKVEDAFVVPDYVKNGKILKRKVNKKNQYDLQYIDKDGYEITIGGLSRAFNKEYWNYAKMISAMLRHKVVINRIVHLVDNLHLNDASLNTWKNGVVRVLSKYIPNGTTPKNKSCPECKQDSLIYQEGCLICSNCGHSKCG